MTGSDTISAAISSHRQTDVECVQFISRFMSAPLVGVAAPDVPGIGFAFCQ